VGGERKTPELREYQALPKLLGVAERAWNRNSPTPQQMSAAWNVFVNTVGQVTSRSCPTTGRWANPDSASTTASPLPGGRIEDGVLTANVRNPGMTIEYSRDGRSWSVYTGPVSVGDRALLRTRAVDGHTSRVSPVTG
jgi:hexosaminidase